MKYLMTWDTKPKECLILVRNIALLFIIIFSAIACGDERQRLIDKQTELIIDIKSELNYEISKMESLVAQRDAFVADHKTVCTALGVGTVGLTAAMSGVTDNDKELGAAVALGSLVLLACTDDSVTNVIDTLAKYSDRIKIVRTRVLGVEERLRAAEQDMELLSNVLLFNSRSCSFNHTNKIAPTIKNLGNGIYQTTMLSSRGTLIILQEYSFSDPSQLVDSMINELTIDEAINGYRISKNNVVKKLADGTTLNGKSIASESKDSKLIRNVLVRNNRNSGVLIVTQIDQSSPPEEQRIIDLFWKSLKVEGTSNNY